MEHHISMSSPVGTLWYFETRDGIRRWVEHIEAARVFTSLEEAMAELNKMTMVEPGRLGLVKV